MIKSPNPDSGLANDLLTLSRTSEGQALVKWLELSRGNILELMTQVADEPRLRQFQGAASVLKDVLDCLNRTP
jgi:hypothetical protein